MARYQLIDTNTGEIVREHTILYPSTYRRRSRGPWLERFLATHEGHIAVAALFGIALGLSIHP